MSYPQITATKSFPFRLKIINAKGVYLILPEEVIRLEAKDNYTYIYCIGSPIFIASRVLKQYEYLLAPYGFVRIHRSHIVNKQHVKKIVCGLAILNDDTKIEISRRKKVEAVRALKS